jgi:hypothetical protein
MKPETAESGIEPQTAQPETPSTEPEVIPPGQGYTDDAPEA